MNCFVLCLTVIDVNALLHPPPTATGLIFFLLSGSLCKPNTKLAYPRDKYDTGES